MTDFRIERGDTGAAIGGAILNGTSGSVLFVDSSGNLGQDNANFFWDNTLDSLLLAGADGKRLIVRGNASQSANLTEWQNSAGTALLSIDSVTKAHFKNSGGTELISLGVTSDTYADLVLGQGAGGTALIRGYVGALEVYTLSGWGTTFYSGGAASVPVVIRGHASQSANLQEWQNSAGVDLVRVAANGNVTIDKQQADETTGLFEMKVADTYTLVSINPYDAGGATRVYFPFGNSVFLGSTSATSIFTFQGRDVRFADEGGSNTYLSGNGLSQRIAIAHGHVASPNAILDLRPSAAEKGLIVQGAASQSANLQEWQDSSAAILAQIDANGGAIFNEQGNDADFRVEGDTATSLLVCDAGLDAVQIGTTTAGVIADFRSASIVLNEDGSDRDSRIEGDNATHAVFVDASADNVGINQSAPLARLHVTESTLGDEVFRIESTATNDDPSERVYQNRVATTDATTTTLHTIAIPASTTVGIEAVVVARRTGGTAGTAEDGGMFKITEVFNNLAGTATSIGNLQNLSASSTGFLTVALTPSGGNVLIEVTGELDTNITWHLSALRTWAVST